jgi:hypothetical protein
MRPRVAAIAVRELGPAPPRIVSVGMWLREYYGTTPTGQRGVWWAKCIGCRQLVRLREPARGRPPRFAVLERQYQGGEWCEVKVTQVSLFSAPDTIGKWRKGPRGWWVGDCPLCRARMTVADPTDADD